MKHFYVAIYAVLIVLYSCQKSESDPEVTTVSVISTSVSTCIANAKITNRGSYSITDHGFVSYYASSDNLAYSTFSYRVSLGSIIPTDTFSSSISIPAVNYNYTGYKWYIRSYITNSKGTLYGNSESFVQPIPTAISIYPTSTGIGDTITITGNNFDPNIQNDVVQFSNFSLYNATVISATKTTLKVIVPNFANSYYQTGVNFSIIVTVDGYSSTLNNVFSPTLTVTGFSPNTGTFGTTVVINGLYLYNVSSVLLGNTSVPFNNYGSEIYVTIPGMVASKKFNIYLVSGSTKILVPGGFFTLGTMTLSSFSPATTSPGQIIEIYGTNFNIVNNNRVYIGSTLVSVNDYNSSFLEVTIPSTISAGNYTVSVCNGLNSLTCTGTLAIVIPTITSISPTSGYWGTNLTISGTNLNYSNGYIYFNGSAYYPTSIDSTSAQISVPTYITPGVYNISLYEGSYQIKAPDNFTILSPTISSISPTNGYAGTSVIISGQGFGTSIGNVSVTFGNIAATIETMNDNQIQDNCTFRCFAGDWLVTVKIDGNTIANSPTFIAQ